jgi:hypothetical protein
MNLTFSAHGHTTDDLVESMKQIIAKIEQGYISGKDYNETGNYDFDVTGEPVSCYMIAQKGDLTKMNKETYSSFYEAQEYTKEHDLIVGFDEFGEIVT